MHLETVKKIIRELLEGMQISFEEILTTEDSLTKRPVFTIKTKESALLIGEHGETFQSLSHLIQRIVQKTLKEPFEFSVDINNYKSDMAEKLKSQATILANRAKDMKMDVEMDPMSSYERLIVHGALTDVPNVKTESIGVGRDRRIIIRYVQG